MPELTTREATERLRLAVEGMGLDDLLDFYHEMFPQRPRPAPDAKDGGAEARREILDHLARGLEVEEILDFWHATFPGSRDLAYDDETGMIHYLEAHEALRYAD